MNSYKRLRLKNRELQKVNAQLVQDIVTLIENKDFTKVTELKFKYTMMKEAENALWYGEGNQVKASTDELSVFNGYMM